MSGPVYIEVSRDGWTKGVQLSINDDNGGFRLSGPKFNGSSETLLKYVLSSERDIAEIESYCKVAREHLHARQGGPDNG